MSNMAIGNGVGLTRFGAFGQRFACLDPPASPLSTLLRSPSSLCCVSSILTTGHMARMYAAGRRRRSGRIGQEMGLRTLTMSDSLTTAGVHPDLKELPV